MFERFTDRARRAVVLAQEEARLLDHTYLGTEHLLLGLIHEREGTAAVALDALDVSLEGARREVEELVGRGPGASHADAPFTPRTVKVFELAFEEGLERGNDYVGTEHLLLGLIAEGGGVAAHVLEHLGAGLESVHRAVIAVMEGRPVERPVAADGAGRELAELLASDAVAARVRAAGVDVDALRRALEEPPVDATADAAVHGGIHSLAIPGLEAFSSEGQHLLMHAHVAAYQHGHEALAPPHLLLGMFDIASGPVHEALDGLGVSLTAVREKVLEALPATDASPVAPIPLTAECRQVLEHAVDAARARGRDAAGPGHVLLALIEEPDGLTERILVDLVGRASAVKVIVSQAADGEGGG